MKTALFILLPLLYFSACSAGEKYSLDQKKEALDHFDKNLSNGFLGTKKYIRKTFEDMVREYRLPVSPADCRDGIIKAAAKHQEKGTMSTSRYYDDVIIIEIKQGRIKSVFYDETNGYGSKRNDEMYNRNMKYGMTLPYLAGTGLSADEIFGMLQDGLMRDQEVYHLDAVTGATESLYRFKTACIRAFMEARKGE